MQFSPWCDLSLCLLVTTRQELGGEKSSDLQLDSLSARSFARPLHAEQQLSGMIKCRSELVKH